MFNAIKPNGHASEIRIISYDLLIMRNFFLAKSQVTGLLTWWSLWYGVI
jgi:hypothetical protein